MVLIKLPGHNYAYADTSGAHDFLTFISTPSSIAVENFLSVAPGVVRFYPSGVATVKLAYLNTSSVNVNKDQHIGLRVYTFVLKII